MSKGVCLYTTVAAVQAAHKLLGPHVWKPRGDYQTFWLRDVFEPASAELAQVPEIKSNATWDIANHIAFLEDHGWQPQVTSLQPDECALAGILDLLVRWTERGQKVEIKTAAGDVFPGVKIEPLNSKTWEPNYGIYLTPAHDQPLVQLKTQSADTVWLTMIDQAPVGLALAALAQQIFRAPRQEANRRYKDVHFPMVDLAFQHEQGWLAGLTAESPAGARLAEIGKAVQQIKLALNDEGARAQAADEIVARCTRLPPPPLVINRPFLLAIERPGLSQPLFVAHVTEEDWKDPGSLAK